MSKTISHIPAEDFEQLYLRLRQKEGRVYTDEQVATLPYISKDHPHYREWFIRKNSCKALLSYIKNRQNILSILEVGCGNGWLAAKLASVADTTGLDINTTELEQAKRVFDKIPGLKFVNGSLESDKIQDEKFDMIVFASSIQYFPSLKQTIGLAIERLTLLGEVHIMDSPFYPPHEIEAARQRSRAWFSSVGHQEMAGNYHHHSLHELDSFQYKILHHPHSWRSKLSIKKNPFYWITIKNRYH